MDERYRYQMTVMIVKGLGSDRYVCGVEKMTEESSSPERSFAESPAGDQLSRERSKGGGRVESTVSDTNQVKGERGGQEAVIP